MLRDADPNYFAGINIVCGYTDLRYGQLNNLGKEALVIIASSLQDQLESLRQQLDRANSQLSDNNRQIELLTEQIRIMNQRQFGKKSESSLSEIDGQMSLFDSFNEAEHLQQRSSSEPDIAKVVIASYRRKNLPANAMRILMDFQPVSFIISLHRKSSMKSFLMAIRNCMKRYIAVFISYRKPLSWMNIMSISMLPEKTTVQSFGLKDLPTFSATVSQRPLWLLPLLMENM